jgi:branched-chain amino acid transport system permease protein
LIARLRSDARLLPILAAVVAAFGAFAHLTGNATFTQAGTYAAIYGIAAIGLSILLGNVNQVSVGQAGFFGIGAYSVAYCTTVLNWPFWPAALLGIVAAGLVGVVVGFVALRFRGHYLAVATLAFGLIAVGCFHETKALGGAMGIGDIPFARLGPIELSSEPAYWFVWAVALLVAMLSLNLLHGRTGRAFEAIRNDELAAEVAGVPTRRYKILAFAYAGALAGLAGAIYASYLGIVVSDAVSVSLSIDLLLMVVLGGSGGVSGALLGAALIGFLDIAGHEYENWREVAYGVLVVLVVVVAPGGLAGLLRRRAARPPRAVQRTAGVVSAVRVPALRSGVAPLAVDGVTKRFGGLIALDGVSFSLRPATLTSLIGPNGAGKTTLFNAVCGIGRLSGGSVAIGGVDVRGWQPHRVAALGVGRTFQNARLFGEMTVLENVVAGTFRTGRSDPASDLFALPRSRRERRDAIERARTTLARLGLERVAQTYAKDLPFGERRRVELARAIAADPWLLLVDEPAAGLNAAERATLHDDLLGLRDAGTTLLLIEHDMRLVMAISDRVMVLEFGRTIADGDASAVRNDPAVIAAYLGTAS